MTVNLTRRKFLQAASIAAAGVPLSKVAARAADSAPKLTKAPLIPPGTFKDTTTVTGGVCEMCFWRCQLVGKVRGGILKKLEGNPKSIDNGQALCARGNSGVKLVYDPDRLKYPMKNVGERGKPKWERISWKEALDTCASKLKNTIDKYGAKGISVWYHGASAHYPTAFFEFLGVPNLYEPAFYQCRGQTAMAMMQTLGFVPNEDVDMPNSKAMLLIGTHIGENIHLSHVKNFLKGLENGSKVIVVDPRFSASAAKAHIWVKIKPGTDTAFLLGLMNYMITKGLYNKTFVEKYCLGFKKLSKHVREWSLAKTAAECDIPVAQIKEVAKILGENAPNVSIHPGRHAAWYGDDFQRIRANACLTALLGAMDVPGGIVRIKRMSTGHVHWPELEHEKDPEDFALAEMADEYPYRPPGTPPHLMRNAMITGDPYPIKSLVVWGTNSIKTMPQQEETIKAIKSLDFIMVTDVSPTDITMYADILLPEACYLERYDHIEKGTQWDQSDKPQQFIAARMPLVDPMFERKDPVYIINELADRMGYGKQVPVKNQEEMVDHMLEEADLSIEKLRKLDGIYIQDGESPYLKPGEEPVFDTDSGKIELYSEALEDDDFAGLPTYKRIEQPPRGFARLIYGRSPVHTFNRTNNNAWLAHEVPENPVWVNDELAQEMGLKDGDRVFLENQDGVRSVGSTPVKVTPGIRKDVLYITHGYGTFNPAMSVGYNKGIDDNSLNTKEKIEPETGICGMRINFVRIVKDGKSMSIPS